MFRAKLKFASIFVILIGLALILLSSGCAKEAAVSNIHDLTEKVDQITDEVADTVEALSGLPAFVSINKVTEDEVNISVYGAGKYPVIVTIYGSSLNDGKVSTSENCNVTAEYQPSSSVLHVVIMPVTSWQKTDTIVLSVTSLCASGDIHYVTAQIGAR